MALRKDWPAIRAEWLWGWQERGTVQLAPLLGTKVLILLENSRPFKTWYREEKGCVVKHTTRYWLGQGVILVPRWDPLEIHFDPVQDQGRRCLGEEELGRRGLFRLEQGAILVLTYQHVEGALHFQRQQWHIRLESYAEELKHIAEKLAMIEREALERMERGVYGGEEPNQDPTVLEINHRQRRREIYEILSRLASRERAAHALIRIIRRELDLARGGIRGILSSKTMEKALTASSANALRPYLVGKYRALEEIKVRPLVRHLNRAQSGIRRGLGALDVGEKERFRHQLNLVLSHLRSAKGSLKQTVD